MPSSKPLVVVIEDHPLVRSGQRMLLEEAGYNVEEIAGAADVTKYTAVQAGRRVILADFDLGPGKTGIELAHEIMKRAGAVIPTLVLSGSFGERSLPAARAANLPVMFKPADEEKVLAWVAEAFRRQGAESCSDSASPA